MQSRKYLTKFRFIGILKLQRIRYNFFVSFKRVFQIILSNLQKVQCRE